MLLKTFLVEVLEVFFQFSAIEFDPVSVQPMENI